MNPRKNDRTAVNKRFRSQRSAFTLIELLTVISIIGVLTSMVLFALSSVAENARKQRTRAQIAKIHELISERWESYRTRPLPIRLKATTSPRRAAWIRLNAMRELMRMEIPDKISDLAIDSVYYQYTHPDPKLNILGYVVPYDPSEPTTAALRSSVFEAYRLRIRNVFGVNWRNSILDYDLLPTPDMWSPTFEGSECLYMILATIQDGDTNGLDFFREGEKGDVDGDGMPEILDGWGQPIAFIRWAPGFVSTSASTIQVPGEGNEDPFDPLKADPRWKDEPTSNNPFTLFPLIYSMGADGRGGISHRGKKNPDQIGYVGNPTKNHFCAARHSLFWNDPYHRLGEFNPADEDNTKPPTQGHVSNSEYKYFVDNISNHMLEAR